MDILIKSSNRAYYLDRCLRSIYQQVKGQFTVKILDDGTPPQYLARITQLYPSAQILRSPLYEAKVAMLREHLQLNAPYQMLGIPTQFWVDAVAASSEYFLLLEDDIWLTKPVDIHTVEETMRHERMAMVRLSWQGNQQLIAGRREVINAEVEKIIPDIQYWSTFVFTNRLKVRSIGYRLGLFKNIMPYQLPLYVLYAVASAFFARDYWLFLWKDAGDKVFEEFQLRKAFRWYQEHTNQYGKLLMESADTSYITSTSNSYADISFDMLQLNHVLNEAWLNNKLDSLQNWPLDFSVEYLGGFLKETDNGASIFPGWLNWIKRFKEEYRRVGCRVE